ncbi:MAG: hypothetical protein V7752_08470 [Halopseudomonas sp.]
MRAKKTNGTMMLCWIAGVVIVVALFSAMYVHSSLTVLSKTSSEINSVAAILDSVSGLRSLLISFSNQCNVAQENWLGALNTSLGLMFLVCLAGMALLVTLVAQFKLNRRLTARIAKLQQQLS